MAFECIAIPTNEAKRRMSLMTMWGTAFRVKYFSLSAGGHNQLDPSIALAIDPSSQVIPGGVELFGPEPVDNYIWQADFCPIYVCKVLAGEYQGYMSSIALYAEITCIGVEDPDPPLLGDQFMYAVCNRPLLALTNVDEPTFHVTVFF